MTASANTAKLSLITRDTARVIGIEGYPTAISDGFALDLNSPIPLSKYRRQKRWREVPTATFLQNLDQAKENTVLLVFSANCLLGGIWCYLYSNNIAVKQKYIDYFLARYPHCQFWAPPGDWLGIIAVKQNDDLVGLVMPVRAI